MKNVILLRISGIVSILFTFFHLAFPLIPEWESSLDAMSNEFKSIFITYHYVIIAFLAGMGYITTFQTKKLLASPIHISILVLFSSLYIIRTITEFTCWGISFPQAAFVLPLCLMPIICYLKVIFTSKQDLHG